MAVLAEGQALALSSRPNTGKSVVYVKLTDSALRSLEECARLKSAESGSPTIQFRNGGGVIVVPGKEKAERFGFSLSKLNEGGSFQCLKATSQGSLESLGTLRETIRVQANDDVFRKTIQKQLQAKVESDSKKTVLLDNNSKDKKKASIPRSLVVKKPVSSSSVPLSKHYSSAIPSASGQSAFSGPGRGGGVGRPSGPRPPSPHTTNKPGAAAFSRQAVDLKKCHVNNKSSPSSSNPEIMKRSLRDRLIHLLAVKPYKKIELIPRLNKDGMKEKEKKHLMVTLYEVSTMNNNCYELKRGEWNNVTEDWPFYTESDLAALRRRKPQNLTPPVSDTGSTSSGHSPSSTNPASPPQITNPLKRQSYYDQSSEAKKKRVSHFKRTEPMSSGFSRSPYSGTSGTSPMLGVGVSPQLNGQHVISPKPHHHHSMDRLELPTTFEDESAPDWAQFHDNDQPPVPVEVRQPSPDRKVNSPSLAPRRSPMVAVSDASGHSYNSPKRGPARTASPAAAVGKAVWPDSENVDNSKSPQLNLPTHYINTNKDFLTNYTAITNSEQRARYKKDFNMYYNQYIQYHQILDKVRARFTNLQNTLKEAPKDSLEYLNTKRDIVEEYNKNMEDKSYQDARHNFQYLHEKLAYVKKLVHEYDVARSR